MESVGEAVASLPECQPLARKEVSPSLFIDSSREHNHGYPTVDPLKPS